MPVCEKMHNVEKKINMSLGFFNFPDILSVQLNLSNVKQSFSNSPH